MSGFAFRPGDLGSQLTIRINGEAEVIHTSCSAPYVAGQPAPLNSPKGDPSSNWFVEGFVDKNGSVVSLPTDPQSTDSCEVSLGDVPSCDTAKPDTLTWRYDGGSAPLGACAGSTFPTATNAKGKVHTDFECTGSVDVALPIMVTPDKARPLTVGPGEEFTISLKESKTIGLSNAGGAQGLAFHTSCSQPIEAGLTAGALTLVALDGQRADVLVTYSYEIENIGGVDVSVNLVVDDPLGVILDTPTDLPSGESLTLSQTVSLGQTTTNTVTVMADTDGGSMCEAMDEVTVTVVEPPIPPGSCDDGKPQTLIFEYTGESCAASNNGQNKDVCDGDPGSADPVEVVFGGKKPPKELTISGGAIGVGDTVTISGSKFSSNTELEIRQGGNVLQSLEIHTSCSQPLAEGDQFGSLILDTFIPK